jgi:ABC-type amino acid transport substrate-binding protein
LKLIKKIVVPLICSLFVGIPLAATAQVETSMANSRLDAILSSGTLRFGIPGGYPPFGKFDEKSGRSTGIDIDEAAAMAKALCSFSFC